MPTSASNLLVAPILGWLTLLTLVFVGYLAHLEYIERRKNRRLEAKRAALDSRGPLPRAKRPLAIRKMVEVEPFDDCPILGRGFQKFDRHGTMNLRSIDLN
jgi:hypothetical protein